MQIEKSTSVQNEQLTNAPAKILLVNGVNLNLLGKREPHLYGHASLEEIVLSLQKTARQWEMELQHFQSNAEHSIVERIHQAMYEDVQYLIINAGAYTHTSVAIRDALLGVKIPFIEVHLSNTKAREGFRHHSYLSDIALGTIEGFGEKSYFLALYAIFLRTPSKARLAESSQ